MSAGAALVWGLLACSPCGPWEDLEVRDPDGLLDESDHVAIEAGIALFIDWTDRTETCVQYIEAREELEVSGYSLRGRYRSSPNRIHVAEQSPQELYRTTTHEICHAADDELGWVSEGAAEVLLPHTESLNTELYDTEEMRLGEAFARICAAGPSASWLSQEMASTCGFSGIDPGVTFVREQLFEPQEPPALGGFAILATEPQALEELDGAQSLVAAAGPDALYALGRSLAEPEGLITPWLFEIDPSSGQVVDRLALESFELGRDESGNPLAWRYSLIASSQGVLLVERQQEAAFRVRSGPLRLDTEPALMVPPSGSPLAGFESSEGLLLFGEWGGEQQARLFSHEGELLRPSPWLDAPEPTAFVADRWGAVIAWEQDGVFLQAEDWGGEVLWQAQLPGPTLRVAGLSRLPSGRVLVELWVVAEKGEDTGTVLEPVSVLYDPEQQSWSAPQDLESCTGAPGIWHQVGGRSVQLRLDWTTPLRPVSFRELLTPQ